MKNNYLYLLALLLLCQSLAAQQLYQHPILQLLGSDLAEISDINSGLLAYNGLGKEELLLDYSTQQGGGVALSWVPAKGLPNGWGLLQLLPRYSRSVSLSGSDKGGYELTANLPWNRQKFDNNTLFRTKGNQRLADHNQDGFRDQQAYRNYLFQHTTKTYFRSVNLRANILYLSQQQHGGQTNYRWKEDAGSDAIYGYGRTNQHWIANVNAKRVFSKKSELQVNTLIRQYRSQGYWGQRQLVGQEDRRGLSAHFKQKHKEGASHFFGFYQRQLLRQEWDGWQQPEKWDKLAFGGNHRRFISNKFMLEGGLSIDYHSLLKWQLLPNLRVDYLPTKKLRLAAMGGRDYRFQRPLLSVEPYLLSQRDWTAESYGPDRLWYLGGLFQATNIQLAGRVRLSYKFVYQARLLSEQLLTDPNEAGVLRQYHHQGQTAWQQQLFTSVQAQIGVINTQFSYRWRHKQLPLATSNEQAYFDARHSLLARVSYQSNFRRSNSPVRFWSASTSYLLRSPLRLPNETQSPLLHNWRCEFRARWKELARGKIIPTTFIGVENLLHQRQEELYTASDEPFSQAFDGSNIWGDPIGQRFYAGVKFGF